MKQHDSSSFSPDAPSILTTNSAEVARLQQQEQEARAAQPDAPRQSPWKAVGIVALVLVLLVGIVVGGGMLSEYQHNKEQEKLAVREQREDSPVFNDASDAVFYTGDVTTYVVQAYYSVENGMMVSLNFANGTSQDQQIVRVDIVLKNEAGAEIASSVSQNIKNVVVGADEEKLLNVYLPPEAVKLTNDSLDPLTYDISAEYVPVS